MNTKRRWAVIITSGVVGVGALAVAAPAIAGVGPFGPFGQSASKGSAAAPGPQASATCPAGNGAGHGGPAGNGMGNGAGDGNGAGLGNGHGPGNGAGPGTGAGNCPLADGTAPASGTLSDAQKLKLAAMVEEEKLAGDLYQAFADLYPAAVFDRIAASEDQHVIAIRTLLSRYGIADPTASKPAGQFANSDMQALYDKLLAEGKASQTAALRVGQQVERLDIADLDKALTGLTAPDVKQAYEHLRTASQQHLKAFTGWVTQ